MLTKIRKWGNSLGLRIPKAFAEEMAVEDGSAVDLSVDRGRLVVRSVEGRRYDLEELLKGVTAHNLPGESPAGTPRGREDWS